MEIDELSTDLWESFFLHHLPYLTVSATLSTLKGLKRHKVSKKEKNTKNVNVWNKLSLKISFWFSTKVFCAFWSIWKVLPSETPFFAFCPKHTRKTVENSQKKLYFQQIPIFSLTPKLTNQHSDASQKLVWASDSTRKSGFLAKKNGWGFESHMEICQQTLVAERNFLKTFWTRSWRKKLDLSVNKRLHKKKSSKLWFTRYGSFVCPDSFFSL